MREVFALYADHVDPHWVAVPLTTTNACSQHEPEWTCWTPDKRDLWVREPPAGAITDGKCFPFWYPEITFEEFVRAFGHWYAADVPTAIFVGIRTAESLHRWRAVTRARKSRLEGKSWTAWKGVDRVGVAAEVEAPSLLVDADRHALPALRAACLVFASSKCVTANPG